MAVEFKIQDFFYPREILGLKLCLDKSQWFTKEDLERFQIQRLKIILNHAYNNVPYYRKLFDGLKLKVQGIKSIQDLTKIPPLSKKILKENFASLTAQNANQFSPRLCRTSGTSGEAAEFYHDRLSNSLEFCYYWRYWSWAGYRLGNPFAEFTLNHFLYKKTNDVMDYSPLTRRLMLNPAQLSYEKIDLFIAALKKYQPQFLKGSPSSIYIFSHLLAHKDILPVKFKAIFTTGEILLTHQRKKIEDTFNCKILDSYGQMERVAAICQCPMGQYHINSDYGLLELTDGHALGTSLYSFAMPLIRYELGDTFKISDDKAICSCGRGLPLCDALIGRTQDIITTPDGRFLSNIFILFDVLEGVLWSQLIQEENNRFKVKLVKDKNFSNDSFKIFMRQLHDLLGKECIIEIEYLPENNLPSLLSQKYKPVISNIGWPEKGLAKASN